MEYKTTDFLRDESVLLDKTFEIFDFYKPSIKMMSLRILLRIYTLNLRKRFKKVKGNLGYALLIVFLGLFSVLTLLTYTERDQGVRVVTLTSGSMKPTIPIASIIVTIPANKFKKGDIITYRETAENGVLFNRTITHRIIDIRNVGGNISFVLKGDGNDNPDPLEVNPSQILGKVVFIFPYAGYFSLLVKTLPGFFVLIALPAYLIIRNELAILKAEMVRFLPQ